MKIIKTKKVILAVIAALFVVGLIPIMQSCSNQNEMELQKEVVINPTKMALDNFLDSIVTNQNIYDNSNTIYIKASKNLILSINKKTLTHGNIRFKTKNQETVDAGWTYFGEIHNLKDALKANNQLNKYSCVEARFESETRTTTNWLGQEKTETFTNMYYRMCN